MMRDISKEGKQMLYRLTVLVPERMMHQMDVIIKCGKYVSYSEFVRESIRQNINDTMLIILKKSGN